MSAGAHRPVLLEEALDALQVRPQGLYVDATFGRGGHARAILERLGPQGRLLVADRDPEAVAVAEDWARAEGRVTVQRGSFAMLAEQLEAQGLAGRIDGLLFDLGVSSPQLDSPGRGFSFQHDGPLDMRMDPESGESAADWLARADADEIARVLRELGEERHARRIARAIVSRRAERPITRTGELAELIASHVPGREPGKHPATRSFQAIRMHINQELAQLDAVLDRIPALLAPGGRVAVISFHSLEDRRVKRALRDASSGAAIPRRLPVRGVPEPGPLRLVGKARRPGPEEVAANPRARSAVLRVAERRA
jgi:16S rRNA (cytosine1402-N4)-methyltransferase